MTPTSDNALTVVDNIANSGALEQLSTPLQIALFLGSLTFLSAALVSVTAFTRIIIVLSFVRRALAVQEIPPNPVLIGLALFMTMFIMGPTLDELASDAVKPYLDGQISGAAALQAGSTKFHEFMITQTRTNDLALFISMSGIEAPETPQDTPLRVLVPAFVISELKTAFIMGFCLYLPFVLIDLVVSTVLMSLGMMMMPPVIISAPFKILLFVLVDGWYLIAQALGQSFQ